MGGYFSLETQGSSFWKSYAFSSGLSCSQAWPENHILHSLLGSKFGCVLGKAEGWSWEGAPEQWPAGLGLWSWLPLWVFATSGLGVRWEGGSAPQFSDCCHPVMILNDFPYLIFLWVHICVCKHKLHHGASLPPLFDKEQLFSVFS